MPLIKLDKIENISDLQAYGSYGQVKKSIQITLGFSVKSKDMNDLLSIIKTIRIAVSKEYNQWQHLVNDQTNIKALGSFDLAKKQLSSQLGIKLPARSWQQLSERLSNIIAAYPLTNTKKNDLSFETKVAYYESNKVKNFIASSKLEGLNITDHDFNVDELVKQYTQSGPTTSTVNNG